MSISIHPRVVNNKTIYPKVNTMKIRKDNNKIINTIVSIEEHLRIHPNDILSIRHRDKLKKSLGG